MTPLTRIDLIKLWFFNIWHRMMNLGAGLIVNPFEWALSAAAHKETCCMSLCFGPFVFLIFWPGFSTSDPSHPDGLATDPAEDVALMREAQTLMESQRGIIDDHLSTIDTRDALIDKHERFLTYLCAFLTAQDKPDIAVQIEALMKSNGFEPAIITADTTST